MSEPVLHDLQSEPDLRGIPIDKVGIRNFRLPLQIEDGAGAPQCTVATVDAFVDLPASVKGTHMSRFVEVLEAHSGPLSSAKLPALLETLQQRLDAQTAHLDIAFPYFITKAAPVSGRSGTMDYQVRWQAQRQGDQMDLIQQVGVTVKTLCPCSKSISAYGAHNQRGLVTVRLRSKALIGIREIIAEVEASASAELYSLLKRPDEKHVTEQAYDNPVFVEDLARNVVLRLKNDPRVYWYEVEAENQESIHNHNAYAQICHRSAEGSNASTP